jgi:hypothetical protein
MSAKSELIERLRYINQAAGLPSLIDATIAPSEHNSIANLLRKGLSIVAFNILEDYIKKRTIEALSDISSSNILFDHLPETLKESSISKALSSLQFQANLLKNEGQDYRAVIQQETFKISSTNGHPFELSKYSFVSSGANVLSTEISDLLKAFGINGGWVVLKKVSDDIGGGIPDLCQAYSFAAKRRHKSAHVAAFQYDLTWLHNLKNEIIAISASIDIILKAKCRQAIKFPHKNLDLSNFEDELNYRFLEFDNGIYRDKKTLTSRSIKNWNSIDEALIKYTNTYLIANSLFIVILDERRRVIDWF